MSTDWGGVLGTVVMAGVATKMTQSLFNNPCAIKSSKKKKKRLTTSQEFFKSPW